MNVAPIVPPFRILACAVSLASVIAAQAGNSRADLDEHSSEVGFTQIQPRQIGIDFTGSKVRDAFTSTQFIDNAGVAAGDIDGDGQCDLFFCGGDSGSVLYRNTGEFTFENITVSAGLDAISGKSLNAAAFADGDGDGDLDLFLGSLYGKSHYMLNDGHGHFTLSDKIQWQESPIGGVTSLALADIDRDGDIDLYTSRYLNTIVSDRMTPKEFDTIFREELDKLKNGQPLSQDFSERFTVIETTQNGRSGKTVNENGLNDVLYLNDGFGNFSAASGQNSRFRDEAGRPIDLPQDWGLSSIFRDADADGDVDLYVCNDFESPDRFWINDGNGFFQPADKLSLRHTSNSSMGVDFADIDRDGRQDFIVVDMLSRSHSLRKKQMGTMLPPKNSIGLIDDRPQIMQNTLFLNQGNGRYSEIAQYAGLKASEWSWAPAFVDVDLDGYNDLIVTTGAIRDFMNADINAAFKRQVAENGPFSVAQTLENQKLMPPLPMRNFVFRNRGDLTFEDIGPQWGFTESAISGGMALADFDNDGDIDIAINNTESPPEIYRNQSSKPRLSVRLLGHAPNTQAIGARLELIGNGLSQSHEITAGGSYASGWDAVRAFALPPENAPFTLTIHWPSGKASQTRIQLSDTAIIARESDAQSMPEQTDPEITPTPLYADISSQLNHQHHEEPYDDFAHQPLLPNRLSQLGPGVSWIDLDQDGDDDLLIPSGRGGKLAILDNAPGGFRKIDSVQAFSDQTTILTSTAPSGDVSFLLGISNHEIADPQKVMSAMPFTFSRSNGWQSKPNLPSSESTTGPMSQADVDGDGDLDLFVGGRAIPGHYPNAATSSLFLNIDGTHSLDTKNAAVFNEIGLVSASAFGDLDQDGDPDLVIACEWGPIRVFTNDKGSFSEITTALGLAPETGWWNGVALGDLNNDGLLDIVATNWGRNSKYEGSYNAMHPLEIFYGDLNEDGTKDIIEAHFDKDMQCKVPERGFSCSSAAMPFVRQKMQTFENFGRASLDLIYGEKLEESDRLTAQTLEHKLFINRGNRFEARSLPPTAQLSPAFGVCIGDMDGDGHEDVFLAQNFFAVQVETPRNDGGRGLLLLGDGNGGFKVTTSAESGIEIYGDQRGAALSDFDRDGRLDLVVTQNGAETKLFKNVSAQPGQRIRLQGADNNSQAIGATLRLKFEHGWGPAKLISSGSGYWSQESPVPVLGTPSQPQLLEVRWPNGEITQVDISAHSRDMEILVKQLNNT